MVYLLLFVMSVIMMRLPLLQVCVNKKINQIRVGALDKYDIYLFISNSMEDFKSIPKCSANSATAFTFNEVFCKQHQFQSAPEATVLCIY